MDRATGEFIWAAAGDILQVRGSLDVYISGGLELGNGSDSLVASTLMGSVLLLGLVPPSYSPLSFEASALADSSNPEAHGTNLTRGSSHISRRAQVLPANTIVGSVIWSLADSPVTVSSGLLIAASGSLTVAAGVTVLFTTASATIEVQGSIALAGTSAAPVVLKGQGAASTAVFVTVLTSGATSSAQNVEASGFVGPALRNVASVSSSTFTGNAQAAQVDVGFSSAFSSCSFTGNTLGGAAATSAVVSRGTLALTDCTFSAQPRAFDAWFHVTLLRVQVSSHTAVDFAARLAKYNWWDEGSFDRISFLTFSDNAGVGLDVDISTLLMSLSDSTFVRNGGSGVRFRNDQVRGTTSTFVRVVAEANGGHGISPEGDSLQITDSAFVGNSGAGVWSSLSSSSSKIGMTGCLVAGNAGAGVAVTRGGSNSISNSVLVGNGGPGLQATGTSVAVTSSWLCGAPAAGYLVKLGDLAAGAALTDVWLGLDTTPFSSACSSTYVNDRFYDFKDNTNLGAVTVVSLRSTAPQWPQNLPAAYGQQSSSSFSCSACAAGLLLTPTCKCEAQMYSYGGGSSSPCSAGATYVSASGGCAPSASLTSGPADTALYLSGGAAEGVGAFTLTGAAPTFTADADFDRRGSCNGPPLHPARRHFAGLSSRCADEQSLMVRKAPARFEPDYPRVSMCRMSAPPDPFDEPRTRQFASGLRGLPNLYNVESLRVRAEAGGEGAEVVVSPLSKLPRVIRVADPRTGGATLMRDRRGVEGDFLKHRDVSLLRRYPSGPRDPETVVQNFRNGLGFNNPIDGLARNVEMTDRFWSEKPQRWFADPSGKPVKVAMVGAGAPREEAGATRGSGPAAYKSQMAANKAALKAMHATATALAARGGAVAQKSAR